MDNESSDKSEETPRLNSKRFTVPKYRAFEVLIVGNRSREECTSSLLREWVANCGVEDMNSIRTFHEVTNYVPQLFQTQGSRGRAYGALDSFRPLS